MRVLIRRLALAGLGAALGACAAKPAPAVQRYALGMARAEYRDYAGAKANPCDAEPRWLSDELTAVNGLLARFLRETAQVDRPEALDNARQLELLREAVKTLPPVLEVHRGTLAKLEGCGFRETGAFPEISRRGAELLEAARARLAQAPAAQAAAAAYQARKQWLEEAPRREATARETWCAPQPKVGQPDLYYARQDADGRRVWRFCDGHVVEQPPGSEPLLLEPDGLTRWERRRIQPQRYLEAARRYPGQEVDRHPDSVTPADSAPAQQRASGGPG